MKAENPVFVDHQYFARARPHPPPTSARKTSREQRLHDAMSCMIRNSISERYSFLSHKVGGSVF